MSAKIGIDCRYCHSAAETLGSRGRASDRGLHVLPFTSLDECRDARDHSREPAQRPAASLAKSEPPSRLCLFRSFNPYREGRRLHHLSRSDREMPLTRQTTPLTMGWCLSCHREPGPSLRGRPPCSPRIGSPRRRSKQREAACSRSMTSIRAPDGLLDMPSLTDTGPRPHFARSARRAAAPGHRRRPVDRLHPPAEDIIPYVDMPERLVPGEPLRFATTLPLSGYGRGVVGVTRQGRPTKVEGNTFHPASSAARTFSPKRRS